MEYNHRYLGRLLTRREQRPRVLWLAGPWLLALGWAIRVALQVRPSSAMSSLTRGLDAAFMLMDVFFVGAPAIFLTWGWLYLAWPEHPRVCCWAAGAALISIVWVPASLQGYVPILIAATMIGAVVEQAIAGRRTVAPLTTNVRAV